MTRRCPICRQIARVSEFDTETTDNDEYVPLVQQVGLEKDQVIILTLGDC